VQDQPSISPNSSEPPRSKTIPDDFIWDEELQGWIPPGEPSTYDPTEWRRRFEESRRRGEFTGGLISVDQLRAAGALDVPAAWRKSLGGEERRQLLPGFDDDEQAEQSATQIDDDRDGRPARAGN
jgi:hypothetical protein